MTIRIGVLESKCLREKFGESGGLEGVNGCLGDELGG